MKRCAGDMAWDKVVFLCQYSVVIYIDSNLWNFDSHRFSSSFSFFFFFSFFFVCFWNKGYFRLVDVNSCTLRHSLKANNWEENLMEPYFWKIKKVSIIEIANLIEASRISLVSYQFTSKYVTVTFLLFEPCNYIRRFTKHKLLHWSPTSSVHANIMRKYEIFCIPNVFL